MNNIMEYKEVRKIEELIDEFHWNQKKLLVIVSYYNLQEFIDIIKDTFEYGYIENAIVYQDGSIGFEEFQEVIENFDVDAEDVFPIEEYEKV